ncbi:MAG: porin, partial [Cytophagaceae bacterium]
MSIIGAAAHAQSTVTLYGRAEATVELGRSNEVRSTSTAGGVTTVNGTTVNAIPPLAGTPLSAGAFGTAAVATGKSNPAFALQDGNALGDGSSRFGLRGKEDLGGGLGVVFQFEAGINIDDGT